MPHQISINQLKQDHFTALQTPILKAIEKRVAPAVSLCIFKEGVCKLETAWGYLNPDEKSGEVTTSHYFDLASVTKLYTTVTLLTLLTEQSIALNTPLVEFIPEFGIISPRQIDGGQDPHSKEAQSVDPQYAGKTIKPEDVTLFNLLTHTSGLPPWRDVYHIAPAPPPPLIADSISRRERWQRALKMLCSYAFVAPPNTGVRYSDIGLMLLGEVVARLSKTSLERAINARIHSDVIYNPLTKGVLLEQIVPTEIDATWRHRRIHGQVHDENACGVGGVAGHAGLFATARTVASLGQMWINREFDISDEFYDQATQVQAQTGSQVRGLGWMLHSAKNSPVSDLFSSNSYGHTGFTGTSLWVDPEHKIVVALLTNRVYDGREKIGIQNLRRTVHDTVIQIGDF